MEVEVNKLIKKWEKEINFRKEGNYKTFTETLELFVKELEQAYQDKLKRIDEEIERKGWPAQYNVDYLVGLEKAKQILEG